MRILGGGTNCGLLFLASVAVLKSACEAASTSRLQVHIPQDLNQKDGYDHRDALFGIPPYGGSIQENVYYTEDDLCGSSIDMTQGWPKTDGKPWKSPFILMVNRGACTFVQKVRNGQRAGAAAVLIADDTCQCGAEDCQMGPNQQTCETEEPIMADDGSGSDISIPSFLVFKADADKIKEVLMQNKPVRVEMSFSVPAPDSRVEYDLWTTPKDPVTRDFLKTFKQAAIALGDKAYFTPRLYIYDGQRSGCQTEAGENQCFSLCTNEGRYCATDPDDDMSSGISGADVVKESLRRTCIWEIYGKEDGIGEPWWEYSREFMMRCDDPEKEGFFTNEVCINDAMVHANVDYDTVQKCMDDSGGLEGNVANKLFDEQLADKETAGAFLIPSFFVNQAPVRGELSFSTVFKAVCAGYASGYEPSICKKCANCNDEEGCVRQKGKCTAGVSQYGASGGAVSLPIFAITLAGLTLLFIIAGYIQHQRQQRHMNEQIRGIVQEYMPVGANQKDTSVGLSEDENEFT